MNELIQTENKAIVAGFNFNMFERWTAFLDTKPKTVKTYSISIKQFISYLRENGIASPTRADIIAYRESLTATHKPTTIQAYLTAVKLFFQWTAQEGLYPNIAEHIKGAKLQAGFKKDYLTPRQAKSVLNALDRNTLDGKRDYALISLLLVAGLRTVEAERANIEDIRPLADDTALYIQGKGRDEKAEYVKIPAEVEQAIRQYLSARGETDGSAPLFASISHRNNNQRLTTQSISRIVKNALRKAGLNSDRLTAHSLRHTTATLNLLNGGTLEETSQLLRHKSINTTMIYAHALERAKNNSEARVAKAIFSM